MKCVDMMTPGPQVCVSEDSVAVAVDLMWDYDCGAIPVVKDMESKELVGIVTDRDIAMHVVKHACIHPAQAKVGDCMSSPAVFCLSDDPLEKAAQLMGEHRVRRIPVVDQKGSCVGIVSQTDLLLRIDDAEFVVSALRKISTPYSKGEEKPEEPETKDKETEEASVDTKKKKPEAK